MTYQELSKFAQWLRRTHCNELVIVSYCGFIKRFENWFYEAWAEPITLESIERTHALRQWHAKREPTATSSTLNRELMILGMFETWLKNPAPATERVARRMSTQVFVPSEIVPSAI